MSVLIDLVTPTPVVSILLARMFADVDLVLLVQGKNVSIATNAQRICIGVTALPNVTILRVLTNVNVAKVLLETDFRVTMSTNVI